MLKVKIRRKDDGLYWPQLEDDNTDETFPLTEVGYASREAAGTAGVTAVQALLYEAQVARNEPEMVELTITDEDGDDFTIQLTQEELDALKARRTDQ